MFVGLYCMGLNYVLRVALFNGYGCDLLQHLALVLFAPVFEFGSLFLFCFNSMCVICVSGVFVRVC